MGGVTKRKMPIMLGGDRHVIAEVEIVENLPARTVEIKIVAEGYHARQLSEVLTDQYALTALAFVGVPADPRS